MTSRVRSALFVTLLTFIVLTSLGSGILAWALLARQAYQWWQQPAFYGYECQDYPAEGFDEPYEPEPTNAER